MTDTDCNAVFVSDLHLLSPRSSADPSPGWISRQYAHHSQLVLGGDVFDFRWSHLPSVEASLNFARQWLEQLLDRWPGTIVYLPGNHDCLTSFLQILDRLQQRCKRFQWHPHFVVLGSTLCLHGDVIDAGSALKLERYRQKFQHTRTQRRVTHSGYDAAVWLRLHRAIPAVRHRLRSPVTQLARLLPELAADLSQVDEVIFGHTHYPIEQQIVDGRRFRNPGAALRHLAYCPVEFRVE